MLLPMRRNLLLTSGLASAYYVAARVGLLLAIGPNHVSMIWIGAGLALAALMAFGSRALAGLAIGMFVANGLNFAGTAAGFGLASALAGAAVSLGSLAQAALAARALVAFPGAVRRDPVRQTLRFALTVVLCGVIGCSVGTLALWSMNGGPRSELLFGWVTWWLGDVTGMLVVAPGLLLLLHPRLREDRMALQPFPLICLGLGLTVFCTFAVGLGMRDAQIERFDADGSRLALTLQTHVELTARDLETLQHSFYKIDVDAAEFRAVATPLLARSPWQSTFEWLPRVARADRDAFESAARGLNGISIREIDADGAVVRAHQRDEYFPVEWTDPEAGREALVGLDHAVDAQRAQALGHALASGSMTATPPLSDVASSPEARLVQTLYAPITDTAFSAGQAFTPGRVRGMVAATLDLAALLQASTAQMRTHGQTVLLFDPDAPGSRALLWDGHTAPRIVEPAERARFLARLANGVGTRQPLQIADRRWLLVARPDWASTLPQPGWLQFSVLCSGLAFTALLTALLAARRRRDEVLQQARDQLEGQVQARTLDLATTNERLRDEVAGHRHTEHLLQDARRHAEAANRAKSQFLANMSHEIRTPLNAVLGYTQLLIEDPHQSGEGRERLRIIHAAGQRLLGLINDVLDLAKIEAGGLQVHLEPIDLRRELTELRALFSPRAEAKGLELRLDVDLDTDRALLTDRAKFGQIVLNLLGNALKFTDAGHILLRAWRADGASFVEVEDTGPGMDAQELATVFTAFRQGAAGVDKGGTGLGLNLSQHIALALGGELTIASERGAPGRSGTRVRLRLPMAEVDRAAVTSPAFRGSQHLAPGTSCRALVVEDDPHSRDVLVTLLRNAGCDVEAAVDGVAGLAACRARPADAPFGIVFSDIRMPRLDGLEMLKALRADERTRALPLIAVSASSLEHERRDYIAQGFQDFVSKPYDFLAIYAMLAQHAGASLVTSASALQRDVEDGAGPVAGPAGDRPPRDADAARARRAAVRAQLGRLADSAADGAMTQVRRQLAALNAAPAPALPAGLLAQLEGDLRRYDFKALEARVRKALDDPEESMAGSGEERGA